MPPHAGEAVRLELHTDRERIRVRAGETLARGGDAVGDTEQRLDVVTHLVGDHVGLGEIAGRAEALAERAEEIEVEIDLVIRRTIERSDGGAGHAARRSNGATAEHQL